MSDVTMIVVLAAASCASSLSSSIGISLAAAVWGLQSHTASPSPASTSTAPSSPAATPPAKATPTKNGTTKATPSAPTYQALTFKGGKAIRFESNGGVITANGRRAQIRGINFFGFETGNRCVLGLYSRPLAWILDTVKRSGFNALRIPFSGEFALNMAKYTPTFDSTEYLKFNSWMKGKSSMAVLDALVAEAAKRGLLVMFDLHRGTADTAGSIGQLWQDATYSSDKFAISAWTALLTRYGSAWNVFAADLKNEPQGAWTWGGGGERDWHRQATAVGNAIMRKWPRLLIFVEGVENHGGSGSWWGGNVDGARSRPVRLSVANRVVYSPHVYGPDVHAQPYFSDPKFPTNVVAVWDRHFGALARASGAAVVPGEWGGKMAAGSKDHALQKALAAYFARTCPAGNFYWCVNPESGDTGGLLTPGWASVDARKMAVIAAATPKPTKFA